MKHITEWELKDLVQLALDKLAIEGFQADGEPTIFYDGDKTETEKLLLRIPVARQTALPQPPVEDKPKRKAPKMSEEQIAARVKKMNDARANKKNGNGHAALAETVEVVAAPVDPFPALG